jgi:uncharacterized protein (TIGR03118 family)
MTRASCSGLAVGAGLLVAVAGLGAWRDGGDHDNRYRVSNLVSDGNIPAPNTDSNLVNGWGVAFNPTGFVWVADNGTGLATLYDGHGVPQSLVVAVPATADGQPGAPTGIVFSGGSDFVVTNGSASGPSRFIFATEDGVIDGWSPQVDLTHAIIAVPKPSDGPIYKGVALGNDRLFATDFHNAKVDVFDGNFQPVNTSGKFTDSHLPAHFAPFGVAFLNNKVFVTFAMQDADAHDEVDAPGLGAIDEFDTDGNLIRRIAHGGALNAPWGITISPADFGEHSNELLVGNFGDGRINTFDTHNFGHRGQLRRRDGLPIVIHGLWGMAFGNGLNDQPTNAMFFAAGPHHENDGVYGKVTVVADHEHGHDHGD